LNRKITDIKIINLKMNYKAIAEWENPKGICLVHPEIMLLTNQNIPKNQISKLFEALLYILCSTNITVIRNSKHIHVDKTPPFEDLNIVDMPEVNNIWIRDWAPFLAKDENGITTAIKFIYSPQYQFPKESKYGNEAGKKIAEIMNIPLIEIPLILDGGNFTHNGKGIGIVTNRLISDNEDFSISEIHDIFRKYLGIEKLIFIPVEPGDITGHTDGSVRFVNENILLVGVYPDEYRKDENSISFFEFEEARMFTIRLANNLKKELGKKYRVIRVTNSIPHCQKRKNDFSPAFGNYINYIRLGNKIILPQYNIPEDFEAVRIIKKFYPKIEEGSLIQHGTKELSYEGGVLNCISWNWW
jgi:agmatine deiminase